MQPNMTPTATLQLHPIEVAPSAMRPVSHPASRLTLIILGNNFHLDVNKNPFHIDS